MGIRGPICRKQGPVFPELTVFRQALEQGLAVASSQASEVCRSIVRSSSTDQCLDEQPRVGGVPQPQERLAALHPPPPGSGWDPLAGVEDWAPSLLSRLRICTKVGKAQSSCCLKDLQLFLFFRGSWKARVTRPGCMAVPLGLHLSPRYVLEISCKIRVSRGSSADSGDRLGCIWAGFCGSGRCSGVLTSKLVLAFFKTSCVLVN